MTGEIKRMEVKVKVMADGRLKFCCVVVWLEGLQKKTNANRKVNVKPMHHRPCPQPHNQLPEPFKQVPPFFN
jgi:hypothetical protein